ncbi:MAG: primosomal replication protein N [Burkholderiaceae bacterium]|nr:primosomal replication protein N [Burkholderiaceae bacterium]
MNQLHLLAVIKEVAMLRYTPAGLPALDCVLAHESQQQEAGRPRKVSVEIKAVVMGALAPQVQALGIGALAAFSGFIAAQRNGRGTVFHITGLQDFEP